MTSDSKVAHFAEQFGELCGNAPFNHPCIYGVCILFCTVNACPDYRAERRSAEWQARPSSRLQLDLVNDLGVMKWTPTFRISRLRFRFARKGCSHVEGKPLLCRANHVI